MRVAPKKAGEPVRVLHVTHDMGVGGAEQVISQLVLGSDPARFESVVVCVDGRIGPLGKHLAERGVVVHRLSRRPGFDRAIIAALRQLIHDERIDVLHCHQYTPYSYGVLAAAFTGVRVVFTEHGRFHPDRHSWKRRLVNPLLARLTDEIVAISAATRDALVRHEWLPRRSIRLIHNGLTPPIRNASLPSIREQLSIDDRAFVLGTIARLDPIKNQAMMIEALALLRVLHPHAVLILAGDGPEREALERRARELGLEDSVRFAGFVTDIAGHLDAIDAFLLTSWSEGTSMTLLEAMSFGKAIVVTSVGGNVEMLDEGVSALFVEAGDIPALAAAIERLVDDPALAASLGRGARERFVERFESTRMVSTYEMLYTGDVPGRGTGTS